MVFLSIGDHLQEVNLILLFKYIFLKSLEEFKIYSKVANLEQQISMNTSSNFPLHNYVTFVKANELALVKFLLTGFQI